MGSQERSACVGRHDRCGYIADEIFGFHAQQAIEKALKAWLALLGVEYPKTHDITPLLSMLTAHGQPVDSFYDLIEFNLYAVQFRYEAFDGIGEPLERDVVIVRVGELVRKVQALIGPTPP
ncbi:MAG TPA: HEPN domain-containing protein [Firmicutes bacterium]|nr:HEPN domain-containing protein [Bacillota bacterium]